MKNKTIVWFLLISNSIFCFASKPSNSTQKKEVELNQLSLKNDSLTFKLSQVERNSEYIYDRFSRETERQSALYSVVITLVVAFLGFLSIFVSVSWIKYEINKLDENFKVKTDDLESKTDHINKELLDGLIYICFTAATDNIRTNNLFTSLYLCIHGAYLNIHHSSLIEKLNEKNFIIKNKQTEEIIIGNLDSAIEICNKLINEPNPEIYKDEYKGRYVDFLEIGNELLELSKTNNTGISQNAIHIHFLYNKIKNKYSGFNLELS